MAVTDAARNGGMNHVDRLLTLFRAYRERSDEDFHRAAEAIIADELTANHHSHARELKKALSANVESRPLSRSGNGLSTLPKDRRYGEPLISVVNPKVSPERLVLAPSSKEQVARVLLEHHQKLKLARYGYAPKTKLLFWGPPGCGKTLTAHWIASELRLPLGIVRLNSLITSFLGETASHIQRIFDTAQSTPMVLLIDEADAIAKDRDDRNDVGELKRVVNSLLQAIDSFRSSDSLVIATSNHQYLLDNALWRRFDDLVVFPMPDAAQLRPFLTMSLNGIPLVGSVETVLRSVSNLSYAQVERGIVEMLKTMILEDRTELEVSAIADYFKSYKTMLKSARSKSKTRINE